jgi:membrane-associated phospholipid phosphatase
VAFAAAAAAASVLQQRGELGRLRWAVASLGVLAAATGAARIGAHRHFPTDVAAGAVLGVAAGWFVPRLMPGR